MLKFLARAHAACFTPPSNGSANGGMLYLPGIFGMIGTDKGSGGFGGVRNMWGGCRRGGVVIHWDPSRKTVFGLGSGALVCCLG